MKRQIPPEAHNKIVKLICRNQCPTINQSWQIALAKYLYTTYRRGTWQDKVYRAVFHACSD